MSEGLLFEEIVGQYTRVYVKEGAPDIIHVYYSNPNQKCREHVVVLRELVPILQRACESSSREGPLMMRVLTDE